MTQGALFGPPPPTKDELLDEFLEANPMVFQKLLAKSLRLKAAGNNVYSIYRLINEMRWTDSDIVVVGKFKINNTHAPRLARRIMEADESLAGFFTTRGLKS